MSFAFMKYGFISFSCFTIGWKGIEIEMNITIRSYYLAMLMEMLILNKCPSYQVQ